MIYKLLFDPRALKEWKKLGETIRTQLKKKLKEVLNNPRVEKSKLSGFADLYKIKLRKAGYRLVYEVRDEELIIFVITVGK